MAADGWKKARADCWRKKQVISGVFTTWCCHCDSRKALWNSPGIRKRLYPQKCLFCFLHRERERRKRPQKVYLSSAVSATTGLASSASAANLGAANVSNDEDRRGGGKKKRKKKKKSKKKGKEGEAGTTPYHNTPSIAEAI